jgi:hypothetical protein
MPGFVDAIYLAPQAGAAMKRVEGITALEGCGLQGDRYCNKTDIGVALAGCAR